MASIPKTVSDRLKNEVPRFKRVLKNAADRDVNESDTVTIITDMLSRIFGFDKYTEITSEQAIRGTYCDLAVQVDGTVEYLIEVKAIGLDLKENHVRQAVNYGANMGISWVVLTNGRQWEIHRIRFEKPISQEHVCTFDFGEIKPAMLADREMLFLLCKEGLKKAAIKEYHEHVQVVNRYVLGALIGSDPLLTTLRRELRRLSPGLKVTKEEVASLLPDVLKRDVIEHECAKKAKGRVQRVLKASQRKKT
jgi:hypothetical protein